MDEEPTLTFMVVGRSLHRIVYWPASGLLRLYYRSGRESTRSSVTDGQVMRLLARIKAAIALSLPLPETLGMIVVI